MKNEGDKILVCIMLVIVIIASIFSFYLGKYSVNDEFEKSNQIVRNANKFFEYDNQTDLSYRMLYFNDSTLLGVYILNRCNNESILVINNEKVLRNIGVSYDSERDGKQE